MVPVQSGPDFHMNSFVGRVLLAFSQPCEYLGTRIALIETTLQIRPSGVWILAGLRDFSVLKIKTNSGAHPAFSSVDTRVWRWPFTSICCCCWEWVDLSSRYTHSLCGWVKLYFFIYIYLYLWIMNMTGSWNVSGFHLQAQKEQVCIFRKSWYDVGKKMSSAFSDSFPLFDNIFSLILQWVWLLNITLCVCVCNNCC